MPTWYSTTQKRTLPSRHYSIHAQRCTFLASLVTMESPVCSCDTKLKYNSFPYISLVFFVQEAENGSFSFFQIKTERARGALTRSWCSRLAKRFLRIISISSSWTRSTSVVASPRGASRRLCSLRVNPPGLTVTSGWQLSSWTSERLRLVTLPDNLGQTLKHFIQTKCWSINMFETRVKRSHEKAYVTPLLRPVCNFSQNDDAQNHFFFTV